MGAVGDAELGFANMTGRLNGARVMTAEGGKYALAPDQRDMMCLTSDGILYVSASHGMNHHVLAFIERLSRNAITFRRMEVPLTTLREIYKEGEQNQSQSGLVIHGTEDTHRQKEVVKLIKECVELGASDIHFRVRTETSEIWIRVHGELIPYKEYPRQHGHELCSTMYNSMVDVADGFFKPERPQDGRLKSEFLKACGLFGARIATRPTERGFLMVLRLLYAHHGEKPTMARLGYLADQVALIRRMTQRTVGINIFSGPTGSGKSTTLECLLSMLLAEFNNTIHLLTLEDPPEYKIAGAVQTKIVDDDWAGAIANAMRLDPDVMMVGEMRDLDSAVAAFRAAMTGHGLWTTLHANDVTSILSRLKDIGVEMSLLTDAALVTGLINQSLAPVLCPKCKIPFRDARGRYESDLVQRVEQTCDVERVFAVGLGCDHEQCRKGIVGRTVIAEVIMPTQAFMSVFQRDGKAAARSFWAKEMDGITKAQHLIRRVNDGDIDPLLAERRVCSLDYDIITLT